VGNGIGVPLTNRNGVPGRGESAASLTNRNGVPGRGKSAASRTNRNGVPGLEDSAASLTKRNGVPAVIAYTKSGMISPTSPSPMSTPAAPVSKTTL